MGGQGGDDDTRRIILGRRARFLAAALASVSAGAGVASATDACGGTVEQPAPEPCLGAPYNPDAQPQPCLSKIAEDAGQDADAALDGASDAAFDADAEPQPCLAPPPGSDGG